MLFSVKQRFVYSYNLIKSLFEEEYLENRDFFFFPPGLFVYWFNFPWSKNTLWNVTCHYVICSNKVQALAHNSKQGCSSSQSPHPFPSPHLINRLCKHSANQNPGQCSLVSHKTASQTQTRGFYAEILIWGKWSKPRQHGPSGDGEGLTYIFINPSLPPHWTSEGWDHHQGWNAEYHTPEMRGWDVEGVESETKPPNRTSRRET